MKLPAKQIENFHTVDNIYTITLFLKETKSQLIENLKKHTLVSYFEQYGEYIVPFFLDDKSTYALLELNGVDPSNDETEFKMDETNVFKQLVINFKLYVHQEF